MRYFIECSHTSESALNTGIQRVVRNIVNKSLEDSSRKVVPVRLSGEKFVGLARGIEAPLAKLHAVEPTPLYANVVDYLRQVYLAMRQLLVAVVPLPALRRFVMAPRQTWGLTRILLLFAGSWRASSASDTSSDGEPALPCAGDVLVLLDSAWHLPIWPAVLDARQRGVSVVCVCYDLIPLTHPQFCDAHLVNVFDAWMKRAFEIADGFVCISRTVADELRLRLQSSASVRSSLPKVSHFWLGSELDGQGTSQAFRDRDPLVGQLIAAHLPMYIYVGTIEPRKNHAFALDLFEHLWAIGFDARLVIVGRVGWLCEDFVERVQVHPEGGRRLHMFNQLDDGELAALYARANGLLFTSVTEGFGLPIVEALQRGVPVFASDIPVFREIGEEQGVAFLDLADADSAAGVLARHLAAGAPRLPKPVPWPDWTQSTRDFWVALEGCLPAARDRGAAPLTG